MTTADAPHAPAGGLTRAWRGFRRWRRSRPFWGGLLTALAGVEMFASTKMTINGLSFASGATGLYSLLIPVILLTCGLLLWLSPGQRLFYSIVAAVTTIYSLMGLNLGGFFVGLLLGLVGSALGFAWTPTGPSGGSAGGSGHRHDEPSAGEQTLVDDLLPAGDPGVPGPRAGTGHAPPTPRSAAPAGDADPPAGSRDPGWFAVALLVLGLAVSGLVALRPSAVHAAPAVPAPTGTACATAPARPATPTPSPSRSASASPSPTPSPEPTRGGNIILDFFRGIGDLFTGGRRAEPSATPSADPTPGARTPTAKATPSPTPTRRGSSTCAPAKPGRSDKVEPGRLMPRIAPEPGQPRVAERPSKLTGSKVTMTGLRFEGIVDLPTANGTLKALKFSMAKAVTDDFKLVADGPAGRRQQYVTDRLTVQGDVAFYAARFSGKLLGIRITLTPDLPFPDGIPITSPIPITFTDPQIDLAFVDSDTLTARPALRLSVP
ncbi:DUF6114 domain-containing protein [Micromonospora coxensis]|uniref:Uncharacterized protein n=1 Tax=Micromonospora coxensis TaxID=356852 RepID=A0A1C5ILR6_9ACTN|nr:DUF6114 domain-containing protein [Micromonospora coxensis]SCG59288.1 hypothetical protein GA0070614_3031 [Micromonospora coxensis]